MTESSPSLTIPITSRGRFFLRAGLVVAWLIGVGGTGVSCKNLAYFRGPRHVNTAQTTPAVAIAGSGSGSGSNSTLGTAPLSSASVSASVSASAASSGTSKPGASGLSSRSSDAMEEISSETLDRYRSVRLPLTVASLLLSIALILGVTRTFARRVGGRNWLRQVTVACALFPAVEYVVAAEERTYLVDRVIDYQLLQESVKKGGVTEEQRPLLRKMFVGAFAMKSLAELLLFAGLFVALGRASVILELAPRDPSRPSVPPSSPES